MDRGIKPIDMPEFQKAVRLVLEAIMRKDNDQYQSLLESIGESNDLILSRLQNLPANSKRCTKGALWQYFC